MDLKEIENKKIVAIILARGGSKGIPRKNIIDLCGKPLLAYSIEAVKKSKYICDVYVSTEDGEIAEVAKRYGAKVVNRPEELASDTASSESALLHFADNIDFDYMVFVQPTSPLVRTEYIDHGIELLFTGDYDSVFSAYEEHWMGKWNEKGETVGWDVNQRPRRQDLPKVYAENGAFYITGKKNFLESKLRYSGRIGILEMPVKDSFQLDTLDDLELFRALISYEQKNTI